MIGDGVISDKNEEKRINFNPDITEVGPMEGKRFEELTNNPLEGDKSVDMIKISSKNISPR